MGEAADEEGITLPTALPSSPLGSTSRAPTREGGEEDDKCCLHLTAREFGAWLDERLLDKYARDFAQLLDDVRPPLLLLQDLRQHLEHIAALFTYQPKRKASGLHGGLAEGRSVLPYVENAIHVASTLPTLSSLALDSVALASLHAQMHEAIQLMLVNLHTLSHVEIDYRPLRNKFFGYARELNGKMGKLAYAVERLGRVEQKHMLFLIRIDSIKDVTSGEINRLLASHAALQEAHQAAKNEIQYPLDKYTAAKRKYEALVANKDLAKGRLLEQQGRHALHRITHAIQGFVPLASALKAKKWSMGEGHGVSRGDAALVNRFVNAATKASFLEDVIASPDQYIQALNKLAVDQVASRQEGLAAYCASFEAEAFRDTIAQWRAATATLYRLMGQGSFKKRFAECKEAAQSVVSAKGELDAAREELERSLAAVYAWMEDWDALQRSVFDCCLAEFGVRVVLVHNEP